ncbi:polyprenyl synthetase family protein [Kordiimonas pumila]|uniref:Polyprenyl synthetase family protein n=1 Tax=Kordiimonas pumila TaxID=2161677 RepID=A0ABV7D771_9PROT|nr:polyprenyl synthetase family protein [Kordiimonas pumila]
MSGTSSGKIVSLYGHTEKDKAASAIDRMQELVAGRMAEVNDTILKRMDSPVSLIPELAGHLISSGGKRLRPMLTLASADLIGYTGNKHIGLATAVEFIHTATLLHDDVVDESTLRRGKKPANLIWGNQPTVLVGDFLFSRAFELMVESDSLKVLKILAGAAAVITEGEVLQLTTANDLSTTEDKYLEVITAKTAILFAAACEVAGVVAGQGEEVESALHAYGKYLGIAFQLVDDALDYNAERATLGKEIGDDFREGKITLPVILAYRRGTDEERLFWKRTMARLKQEDGDLDTAIELLEQASTLDDTIKRAHHYGAMAKDALAIFKGNPAKQAMLDIVDFCISRAY